MGVLIMSLFKYVVGFEGHYRVSNNGSVVSLKRGSVRQMKIGKNTKGYRHITLCLNGKQFCKTVHRMVAEAFIPNPHNKPMINHIDGNRLNNNVTNLEWCTNQENIIHALKNGLQPTKLSEIDVAEIRTIGNSEKQYEIANRFNIDPSVISDILNNKIWKHVN